jgi:UDP-N-acetylglucosamine--N-acetylmuramyl-(pentapeptide) pyrophosphoryl-undecaprenol N-acetylglucosamine transferase
LHDSDAHPGLTNRVLSRWARRITTGAPLEYYDYPKEKSQYIGIPISQEFHKLSATEKARARREWGIKESGKLIVITGGGLGATRINNAVAQVLPELTKVGSVVLISGNDQYEELRALTPQNDDKFHLFSFVDKDMAGLLGAADLVIARAGATTILELAAVEVPTVLIPNARLTGGHQTKNAAVYKDAGAVEIINEEEMELDPSIIVNVAKSLVDEGADTKRMVENFKKFAKPKAATAMADIVTKVAQ